VVFEADHDLEGRVVSPRTGGPGLVGASNKQVGVVGAAVEAHFDARAHKVHEDVAGVETLVELAEGAGEVASATGSRP